MLRGELFFDTEYYSGFHTEGGGGGGGGGLGFSPLPATSPSPPPRIFEVDIFLIIDSL